MNKTQKFVEVIESLPITEIVKAVNKVEGATLDDFMLVLDALAEEKKGA